MYIWLLETITILLQSCIRTVESLPAMRAFGEDATAVFNMLSGYSEPKSWNRLIVAPIWMKDRFLKLIEREAEYAKKGMPGTDRGENEFSVRPEDHCGSLSCFFLWSDRFTF